MNTRINPTTNGLMHLGHAYLALVNAHMAKSSGGRFYLRCEDNQTYWLNLLSADKMKEMGRAWEMDLKWLGIPPVVTTFESDQEECISKMIHKKFPDAVDSGEFPEHPFTPTLADPMYPYDLYLTAKVRLMDSLIHIDTLICGVDLLPRYSLYAHMSDVFGLPHVKQIFLPRLMGDGELDNVSKTKGNYKLSTFRDAGYKPEDIHKLLRKSCLKQQDGEWTPDNIKEHPAIVSTIIDPVVLTDIDPMLDQ